MCSAVVEGTHMTAGPSTAHVCDAHADKTEPRNPLVERMKAAVPSAESSNCLLVGAPSQ